MMRRLVVAVLVAATLALVLADVVLIALPRSQVSSDFFGTRGIGALSGLLFTGLGAAIALRQPRNIVGWMFLVSGILAPVVEAGGEYASYSLRERDGTLPGTPWALWLAQLALPLAFGPLLTYLLLVFPDGRLPSARWRPVALYALLMVLAWAGAAALVFESVGYFVILPNPVSTTFAISVGSRSQSLIAAVLVAPAAIMCCAGFVYRFWRSHGVERQQLKWVAYAGVIAVGAVFLLPASSDRKALEIVKELAILTVPLAAGIAILRYRLYDIDLLIKRTVVYGSLTTVLGVAYIVSVLILQRMLGGVAGGSDVAVAGSTLFVVALFQPIRTRVQAVVDRRFDRARYDAARTIDAFSVRLRGDVDLDSVRADLVGVVHETVRPAHASVWIRPTR